MRAFSFTPAAVIDRKEKPFDPSALQSVRAKEARANDRGTCCSREIPADRIHLRLASGRSFCGRATDCSFYPHRRRRSLWRDRPRPRALVDTESTSRGRRNRLGHPPCQTRLSKHERCQKGGSATCPAREPCRPLLETNRAVALVPLLQAGRNWNRRRWPVFRLKFDLF